MPGNHDLLVHLALQNEVGRGAGQRGRAANASRVAHTQTQAFGQTVVPVLHSFPSERQGVWIRLI